MRIGITRDGTNTYLHAAWSTSSDGTKDFSLIEFDDAVYIGTCTGTQNQDITDPVKYVWQAIEKKETTEANDTNQNANKSLIALAAKSILDAPAVYKLADGTQVFQDEDTGGFYYVTEGTEDDVRVEVDAADVIEDNPAEAGILTEVKNIVKRVNITDDAVQIIENGEVVAEFKARSLSLGNNFTASEAGNGYEWSGVEMLNFLAGFFQLGASYEGDPRNAWYGEYQRMGVFPSVELKTTHFGDGEGEAYTHYTASAHVFDGDVVLNNKLYMPSVDFTDDVVTGSARVVCKKAVKYGQLVFMTFLVTKSTSTNNGADVAEFVFATNPYPPVTAVTGIGYYGNHSIVFIMRDGSDGLSKSVVRNASSSAVTLSNGCAISLTYITSAV